MVFTEITLYDKCTRMQLSTVRWVLTGRCATLHLCAALASPRTLFFSSLSASAASASILFTSVRATNFYETSVRQVFASSASISEAMGNGARSAMYAALAPEVDTIR